MPKIDLKGIHRVRRKIVGGGYREYHYAWRGKGAPLFWRSDSTIPKGSAAYIAALAAVAPKGDSAHGKFRAVILAYLDSREFQGLGERTQRDIKTNLYHPANGVDAKFGSAPISAANDARFRKAALDWRDGIASAKVGDDRIRTLQKLVSWGVDRGMIQIHHLRGIRATYKVQRSEILWTDAEIETFEAGAPAHIARILSVATETGLRPGDLATLSPASVQHTTKGRRLLVMTAKRNRLASIPVTPKMGRIIDATPQGQTTFIATKAGAPYQNPNYLGDAVSLWRTKLGIRPELRLYDARGTAATRLLNAGAEMREIATHMGWSIKHASSVIERYVALHPDMTDALADKLNRGDSP